MSIIKAKEIRDKFLAFFQEKNHLLIENASIIPKNDPTLLFINSGMAPIKRFFTGEETPKSPRLCNIQPCIRTIDIDEIGDKHHLTSFQMLGSWSINDYFKEKAISLAYEFLTAYLKIPKEKLYVTVFSGDETLGLSKDIESASYWEKVGIPKDHIVSCGKDDNFWGPTSETGPCGPCTEVFYDTGKGQAYIPGGDFDTKERYIEIWNAGVFMQLNKNSDGTYSRLGFTSVDTGAGLERLVMALGGCESVYETDMLAPIKEKIEDAISENHILGQREFRILTDHLRTISLILSEGVKPSNEGRGYIPRKLIRKCIMLVMMAKLHNFNFEDVIKFIITKYSELYPDFKNYESLILSEFTKESNQFKKVLEKGLVILNEIKEKSNEISAQQAFDLVTTYGVPFDIIVDYASGSGIKIDEAGFKDRLEKHKEISKQSVVGAKDEPSAGLEEFDKFPATNFMGYESSKTEASILGILVNGSKSENRIKIGDKLAIALDTTCMYAESGGQAADQGIIISGANKIKIYEVKKNKNGVFVHFGNLESGDGVLGKKISVEIDTERRKLLANNHSAVHLLQSALKKIFGNDIHQCGSKVEQDMLRFDFNYDKIMAEEDLFKVEKLVNSYIRENVEQKTEIKSLSDAIKDGATALFDNKYSNDVRVVSFGDLSKELCGGTHTSQTGNIGLFCIVSTESIGKGIKRIVAFTGEKALEYIHSRRNIVKSAASLLKVSPEKIIEKISTILNKNNKKNEMSENFGFDDIQLAESKSTIKLGYIIRDSFNKKFNEISREIADKIKGIFLGIFGTEKKRLLICVSSGLKGSISANELMHKLSEKIECKGGGNERVASGGTNAGIDEIIETFAYICAEL